MLHHIQRSVLDSLASVESAPYSKLKPIDMSGNSFTYHLKQLLIDAYIERTSTDEYRLTQVGRNYVVHRYENPTTQAHSIFLVALKVDSLWLLRERCVQPLLGYIGFVHGEPSADESLEATAQKRLQQKTGLAAELEVRSCGLIKIYKDAKLQSFSHVVVLYGELSADEARDFTSRDETGKNLLAGISADSSLRLLPSCHDILVALKNNDPWFDLTYRIQ